MISISLLLSTIRSRDWGARNGRSFEPIYEVIDQLGIGPVVDQTESSIAPRVTAIGEMPAPLFSRTLFNAAV